MTERTLSRYERLPKKVHAEGGKCWFYHTIGWKLEIVFSVDGQGRVLMADISKRQLAKIVEKETGK